MMRSLLLLCATAVVVMAQMRCPPGFSIINAKFTVAGTVDSFRQTDFIAALVLDLGVTPDDVTIKSVRGGSVLVETEIRMKSANAAQAETAVQSAVASPTSNVRRQGNMTVVTSAAASTTKPESITARGFIIDNRCIEQGVGRQGSGREMPAQHSLMCLFMPPCVASGYSIMDAAGTVLYTISPNSAQIVDTFLRALLQGSSGDRTENYVELKGTVESGRVNLTLSEGSVPRQIITLDSTGGIMDKKADLSSSSPAQTMTTSAPSTKSSPYSGSLGAMPLSFLIAAALTLMTIL